MRQIKIYPTITQKKLLKKWFDDSRCTYNLGIQNINEKGLRSWMSTRNDVVTYIRYYCPTCNTYPGRARLCKICGNELIQQVNDKLTEEITLTPKHIRLSSIKNLYAAYKSAITNIQRNNIKYFHIKHKSKKIKNDSIEIELPSFKLNKNSCTIYSNEFKFTKNNKKMKKKTLKQIPDNVLHNPKICYNGVHKFYYLAIPLEQEIKPYKFTENKILSLDPGVKTLLTGYDSNNGNMLQFENRVELLKKLKKKIAEMQTNKKRYTKWYKRFDNIINDNHTRISNYITNNYDVIFLPKFESQKLKSKNKYYNYKHLNMNKHYQLQQKLLWLGLKKSKKVLIVSEEYTSKTCGVCGTINKNLNLSNRTYSCISKSCNYKVDRDYNGARNILIKTLVA